MIKTDLCAFVQDFFQGAYISKEISSTTLVLLPKVEHARSMSDFRPISLGNFCGKIISKILARHLAKILPSIVDGEQAGVFQGRMISTHIVLAQDIIRDINRKVTRGKWFLNWTWQRRMFVWSGTLYSELWQPLVSLSRRVTSYIVIYVIFGTASELTESITVVSDHPFVSVALCFSSAGPLDQLQTPHGSA